MAATVAGLSLLVAVSILAVPLAIEAQKPARVPRVGQILVGPVPSPDELAKSVAASTFLRAMRQLGWIEGQNITFERRWGESVEQLRAAAAELVRLRVDLLIVPHAALAKITQLETRTIPILILAAGSDLVEIGLVASLGKPGGNVTGTQVLQYDLVGKRIELLRQLVPGLARAAVLRDCSPDDLGVDPSFARRAQSIASRALSVELNEFCVRPASDFSDVFRRIRETGNRGLLVSASPVMDLHHKQIVDLAQANGIPAMYDWKWWVEAGALVSYGSRLDDLRRGQANYVDKILKGAAPGDLPIQQPTRFELAINMKALRALRLAIPPSLLVQADLVIE